MPEATLFVEDIAHQNVIGAIISRVADESKIQLKLNWRSARQGHGKVVSEFRQFARDLQRQGGIPDFVVAATDGNCKGPNERAAEFNGIDVIAPLIVAIPDPHIERWLLLDGAAFRTVFGRGCDAPDQKCDRHRYKQKLMESVREAGVEPSFGGIEYAKDIIAAMDLDRAARSDQSFSKFINDIRRALREIGR